MIALTVSLQVVPGCREDFLKAIEENAERSFTDEPGCRYFDIVCDLADDHHFVFHEIYDDEAAVEAHGASEHFQAYALGQAIPVLESRARELFQTIDA